MVRLHRRGDARALVRDEQDTDNRSDGANCHPKRNWNPISAQAESLAVHHHGTESDFLLRWGAYDLLVLKWGCLPWQSVCFAPLACTEDKKAIGKEVAAFLIDNRIELHIELGDRLSRPPFMTRKEINRRDPPGQKISWQREKEN